MEPSSPPLQREQVCIAQNHSFYNKMRFLDFGLCFFKVNSCSPEMVRNVKVIRRLILLLFFHKIFSVIMINAKLSCTYCEMSFLSIVKVKKII